MSTKTESMTSQDMLDRSSTWTLACDNALLSRLKKFSEDLTNNSQDILKECDNLSRNINQLDYRLINVSNEFLMLSNTQFVENRVEEFEEFSSAVPVSNVTTISKTKAEKEAALLSKMRQAIQLGLSACTERRNKNDVIVNRFKMNQPYIIGSPKFFSSKYCGLVDENRKRVPSYYDSNFMDSMSISNVNDVLYDTKQEATVNQDNPEIKFTMPPTPVFPAKAPFGENTQIKIITEHQSTGERDYVRPIVPPSPTISDRSSEVGGGSASTISRENATPRAVTDELNKIYGSFAPPPTADDDSDDDFRPSAGVGRIFDDDCDDIFGEKELFPPSQKKTDFFGRSNPSQLPTPVFSVPPPINPVLQSKPAVSDVQTLVGPKPKMNDTPNLNCVTGDNTKNEFANDTIREPPSEVEGSIRPKLPPGAVSMFGSLPPPMFNNGTLQAAQTANTDAPVLASKPDTQISSYSSTEVGSGLAPTLRTDNNTHHPSHNRADVDQNYAPSQPSHNVTAPGRTENISQGSLSGFGDIRSKPKTQTVPVSSLFSDDSSDEDIFRANKKQEIFRPQKVAQSDETPINSNPTKSTFVSAVQLSKKIEKTSTVKKSIFEDSESEDDLFSSRPIIHRPHSVKAALVNDNTVKHNVNNTKESVKVSKKASLFGDDSDSDTDLFGNKKKEVKKSSSFKATSKMEDINVDKIWDEGNLFKESVQQVRELNPAKSSVHNNNNNEDPEESSTSEKSVLQSSSSDSVRSNSSAIIQHEPKEKDSVVKKSIFDDSDSDDDLFSSKHSSSIVVAGHSDVTPSLIQSRKLSPSEGDKGKKQKSLFEDDSDSDNGLFASKPKRTEKSLSLTLDEEVSKNKNIEEDQEKNSVPFNINQQKPDETDAMNKRSVGQEKDISNTFVDNKHEDESNKYPKVLGSKISEKIKAMQSTNEGSKSDSTDFKAESSTKKIKSKVSVKSLALNLNINPLALKVGAKPPKAGGSTPSTPDIDQSDQSPINDASLKAKTIDLLNSSTTEIVATQSITTEEVKIENHIENVDISKETQDAAQKTGLGVNELVGILKARVKIQKKRRPPSRTFLKSFAINIESDDNQQQTQNAENEVVVDDNDEKTKKAESDNIKDAEDGSEDATEESE